MDAYRTEEEQIEAIKGAWAKYGNSVVTGVLAAVSVVFAYKWWDASNIEQAEAASDAYEQVIEAQQAAFAEGASDEDQTNLVSLANALVENHDGSTYALMTSLLLAKLDVEKGELDSGAKHLQWVIDQKPNEGIALTAKVRLAKVYIAQEKLDEALGLIEGQASASHKVSIEELKGDIYRLKNELDKARTAYQLAASAAKSNGGFVNPLLQMKIDDLATP